MPPANDEWLARMPEDRTALEGLALDLHVATIPAGARVTDAAVLVPLVTRPRGVQVLLTQRTAHLSDHAGQISFPGGRVEPEDGTREETALRETEEEIGLARNRVRVLGRLPHYDIPSGFRITPVVGWVVCQMVSPVLGSAARSSPSSPSTLSGRHPVIPWRLPNRFRVRSPSSSRARPGSWEWW